MEADEARAELNQVGAQQRNAVEAVAGWRWPRWYLGATAVLMFGISVVMDFSNQAAFLIVVYCCGVSLLQNRLVRTVQLRQQHQTFAVTWPSLALIVLVSGIYALCRVGLDSLGAKAPSTIAGAVMTVAYLALSPLAQRMSGDRLRRRGA
jgi:uncharacterized membrane protein HdeD (DUF308 family)